MSPWYLLFDALKAAPRFNLEHLDLSHNSLGDAGATLLADALRSTTPLKTLRLNGNGLRSSGGEALTAMLSTNRSVRLELRADDGSDAVTATVTVEVGCVE